MKFSALVSLAVTPNPIRVLNDASFSGDPVARVIRVPSNVMEFESREAYVAFVSDLAGKLYDGLEKVLEPHV